ncbi:MAG: LapA family protein [Anaerovoracaceae bacterium]|jgi:putative membrane protein
MDIKFVVALIGAVIVAIFAIQNAAAVEINFLLMEFSISQALIILISAMVGALIAVMLGLIRRMKQSSRIRSSSKTITSLEAEVKQLKEQLEVMNAEKIKADEELSMMEQEQSTEETVNQ